MSHQKYVIADHSEADRLKDLTSIGEDFGRCESMCRKLIDGVSDPCILDALSTAAVILYARPFMNGRRLTVKTEDIVSSYSDDEDLSYHEKFLFMRSRHVAHSVNEMEKQELRIWLNPDDQPKGIQQIHVDHQYILSLRPDHWWRLLSLALQAGNWISKEVEIEEARLMKVLRGDFDIDQLYTKEPVHTDLATLDESKKVRKNGQQ